MIRFSCPFCGVENTSTDGSAATQTLCGGCGESIPLPGHHPPAPAGFRPTHVWDEFFVTSLAPVYPSRQSPLRPWTWTRSTWSVVAPVLLVIYFLSAVPVTDAAEKSGVMQYRAVNSVLAATYAPVWWCMKNSPLAAAILGREHELVAWLMTWMGLGEAAVTPPA